MRDLITQAGDYEQVRRRDVRLVRNRNGQVGLRYVAPNGRIFFIEPNGYPQNIPKIFSKWPVEMKINSGHSTHYYGNGYIDAGINLTEVELGEILDHIDIWSKGFEKYLGTERGSDRQSEALSLKQKICTGKLWAFLRRK